MRRNRGGVNPFVLMLGAQLAHRISQLPYKPPVTLALVALQVYLFVAVDIPPSAICISFTSVIYFHEYARILLAAVFHASDWHLYYNMSSFVWKGLQLEHRFGSILYGAFLLSMTVITHALYLALALLWSYLAGSHALATCAVGFSGVIFAMKTVLNYQSAGSYVSIMGLTVQTKYAAWLELLVISVLVPNASFIGHLAGILAGFAWLHGGVDAVVVDLAAIVAGTLHTQARTFGYNDPSSPRFAQPAPRQPFVPSTGPVGGTQYGHSFDGMRERHPAGAPTRAAAAEAAERRAQAFMRRGVPGEVSDRSWSTTGGMNPPGRGTEDMTDAELAALLQAQEFSAGGGPA